MTETIGPFIVERRLGQGGMAELFLAKKPLGGSFKRVVVKRMLPLLSEDARFVDMFEREAAILAELNHANVVQIFDLGTTRDGQLYIAMEFLDGLSIHDLAVRAWKGQRPLPIELVLRVLAEAARGLDYVHSRCDADGRPLGLVHRDIAPDNLFFVRDGTVKLLDFGVARGASSKVLTGIGEVKGKLPFMAPEQLEGESLDGRTDLFSLGVTAYWLLTGRRPFRADNDLGVIRAILKSEPEPLSRANPDVPAWLETLVHRLLSKERGARVQSGAAVERTIVKNAGSQLDRARDVAFFDALFELTQDDRDDVTSPIPAARRVASGIFARAHIDERSTEAHPRAVSMMDIEPIETGDFEEIDEHLASVRLHDTSGERTVELRPRPVGEQQATRDEATEPRNPVPKALNIALPADADDGGDTVRLTESQLGLLPSTRKRRP